MASPDVFIVVDTESVPDGTLLARVKYPGELFSPEAAIARAQAEAKEKSVTGSDFLPVSFQYPVAICLLIADKDYTLKALRCLDAPQYRPRQMTEAFWNGLAAYKEMSKQAQLVTFNGRGFDLPLLEMAAFRYGVRCGGDYFVNGRQRFGVGHLDLLEWLTNYGACRGQSSGGLNLFSKLLGKPGKMQVAGDQVYEMFRAGKLREINEYCTYDTLDTYFVFLRTRVISGELSLDRERELVKQAREWLAARVAEVPALQLYLANWGDWEPWP
jgi:predicted PolB exonuclease-like 3'-5' exonuclease